jgi:hypothetical protein
MQHRFFCAAPFCAPANEATLSFAYTPGVTYMTIEVFAPVFAWNWFGHGELTSLGLGLAMARLIVMGKTYILERFRRLATPGDWENARRQEIEDKFRSEMGSAPTAEDRGTGFKVYPPSPADYPIVLFSGLPHKVQMADLHAGNVVGYVFGAGAGERAETDSQVRHFMRSRPEVTSEAAYRASYEYIQGNCIAAWASLKQATTAHTGWWDQVKESLYEESLHALIDGEDRLALALHTLEDSFAPGHVTRNGSEVIEKVHIWNDENKKPDPSSGWPGHEALDDPSNTQSRPHYYAAQFAVRDLIYCIFSNLDQEAGVFRTDLGNVLWSKLAAVCKAD